MKDRKKTFGYLLVGLIVLFVIVLQIIPKPINWKPTYKNNKKSPYGAKILYERLNDIFPEQEIEENNRTLYEVFCKDCPIANYIHINQKIEMSQLDAEAILEFVDRGGEAFLAAEDFSGLVADTFGLETNFANLYISKEDSLSLLFVNPSLQNPKDYPYRKGSVGTYFSRFDSTQITILATNSKKDAVLLKAPFGEGSFYFSSTPIAFTNYNVLWEKNYQFIENALSYLPQQTVIWDEYYKGGTTSALNTPFRFVWSRPSLRWALILTIFGTFLYLLFEAKRTQRIIPIIKPLANTTLEFTETIGRLYFQKKDHKNIAEKKITYFFEYVRTHFYLNTQKIDEEFIEKLAYKSDKPIEEIRDLMQFIRQTQEKKYISDKHLADLSKLIDTFKYEVVSKA